ncbi:MAG: hypothetical protein REI64_11920 [Pedobacter sp.]|uniref:hypothetical protein n=1 Tax=Bacteroidota TaxID=976 RepID=UPI002809A52C|nr:hypothetical protein [Pedobacter sp.]MDQ8005499.1 hypothetical protein [Pedobacter sp.]
MKIDTIYINEIDRELRIGDILGKNGYPKLLPSDFIIDKVRPNFGATQLELDCDRNSIIAIPLIDVMDVKKHGSKHDICVVNGNTKTDEIKDYISSDRKYKKFMVTPDSFTRLLTLLKKDVAYREYFLLYDECDQLITHCLFRKNILKPMEYFFEFENKALISATPIIPNDTRFKDNGFKILRFQPLFDYSNKLTLITTNNLRTSIRNILTNVRDNKPIFIFSNCVKTMLYASRLDFVKDNCKVFCSDKIETDFFSKEGVLNIENTVASQEYEQFNFLTSRFFSALDIYVNVKPHIVYITNVPQSKPSIIDPFTDAIQIMARCRNSISSITHITTLYQGLPHKLEEDLEEEFNFSHKLVSKMKTAGFDFENETVKTVLNAVSEHNIYKILDVDAEHVTHSYFKQSLLHKLKVENYYTDGTALKAAYEATLHFKVNYRNVCHAISEEDRLKLNRLKGREKRKAVANGLYKLIQFYETQSKPFDNEFLDALELFKKEDELVYELFFMGMLENMQSIDFKIKELKQLYYSCIIEKRDNTYSDMIDYILTHFPLHVKIYSSDLKAQLQRIYDKFSYVKGYNEVVRAKANSILNYFEGKLIEPKRPDKTRGYETYYILGKPRYSLSNDLSLLAKR